MPSFKSTILLRADLTIVQLPVYVFLSCIVSPLVSQKLLAIMWPESFCGFTFDLGPSSRIMVLDTYNTYGSLRLVLEVCDMKTVYIKPHTFNALCLICN